MRNRTTASLLILDHFLRSLTLALTVLYHFCIVAGISFILLRPIYSNVNIRSDSSFIQRVTMSKAKSPFSINKPESQNPIGNCQEIH